MFGERSLKGWRMLDAGCGTGHQLVGAARRYPAADFVGIENWPSVSRFTCLFQMSFNPPPSVRWRSSSRYAERKRKAYWGCAAGDCVITATAATWKVVSAGAVLGYDFLAATVVGRLFYLYLICICNIFQRANHDALATRPYYPAAPH